MEHFLFIKKTPDTFCISAVNAAARGKGQKGGTHRLQAQVADNPQCNAETSAPLAAVGGAPCLKLGTVADTISRPALGWPQGTTF